MDFCQNESIGHRKDESQPEFVSRRFGKVRCVETKARNQSESTYRTELGTKNWLYPGTNLPSPWGGGASKIDKTNLKFH